jgi:ParB/RepB/Spo0J family partition protein
MNTSARQPVFQEAPLGRCLPPLDDLRDRTTPEHQAFTLHFTEDVKERGVQVPVIAFQEGDSIRIIDGESRRLAALTAGLATIPALVYPRRPEPADLKRGQLLANSMRRDMTPLETAAVYQALKAENGWSDAELARKVHTSPSRVAKTLAVSTKLCEAVRELVAAGRLPLRAAYAISRCPDFTQQIELAEQVNQELLTAEAVEEQVARLLSRRPRKPKAIKVNLGGVVVVIAVEDLETIHTLLAVLDSALKRIEKHGLPLSSLPSLVKSN